MTTRSHHPLLDRLRRGPVLLGDGAMGTQLYQRGAPLDAVFEYLNLLQPHLVELVHTDYLAAGAELIETNTFGANRRRLAGFGLDAKVAAINRAGARLAREAAGPERLVAGAVGPLPRPTAGDREPSAAECRQALEEQMAALAEGGVDCFLLETFGRVSELLVALEVAAALDLPAIAQLAFTEGGFTGDGLTVEAAVAALSVGAPAALGANCGAGPRELLGVVQRLAAVTDLPISAFPNSGFPEYVNGRHIYLASPGYFAELGRDMVAAGAHLVGGCCGTGPEHIRALGAAVRGQQPAARPSRPLPSPAATVHFPAEPLRPPHEPHEPPGRRSRLLENWGKRPVITVELDLPRGPEIAPTLERARQLAAADIDGLNLAENPLARIRMGNLALGRELQDQTGLEVIVHITGRDRNLIGLHADLMGAHLLGLRTVLAVTGDPVSVGGETGASSVFDLNAVGLLKLLTQLNRGRNLFGAELGGETAFLAGAAFNPNVTDLSGQLHKLHKKLAAGARFVQTQPIFDPVLLERMMTALDPLDVPVLVGVMPLVSGRNAEFLHNEVPGIRLPEAVRQRMRNLSGEAGRVEGMAVAGELIAAAKQLGVGGYYLIPPFGKVTLALDLIRLIRGAENSPAGDDQGRRFHRARTAPNNRPPADRQ